MNNLRISKVAAWVTVFFLLSPIGPACSQSTAVTGQNNQPAVSQTAWNDVLKPFGPTVAGAIVALLGAWFVTLRLSAQWEARKKRAELDIMLARDFYRVVASFKAIAREGGALGSRPQQAPEEWDKWHTDLLRRVITAESDMEAILLALVSEGSIDEGETQEERQQRLQASGLLRVAFRSLREQIERHEMHQPGFGDPLFWLMNRVQGELSRLVFARAVRKLRKPSTRKLTGSATDYLNLIAYRTADLETAAGRLSPHVVEFFSRRKESRDQQRICNVQALFRRDTFAVVTSAAAIPSPLPANMTTAVIVSDDKVFVSKLNEEVRAALETHPTLMHVLFIGDHLDKGEPPGSELTEVHAVYVGSRGREHLLSKLDEQLPRDLPYKSRAELLRLPSWLPEWLQKWLTRRRGGPVEFPPRGVALLGWSLNKSAEQALHRIAEAKI